MRYFEFSEIRDNDYEILEDEVPSGTRPRYVLRHKKSMHKHFLKTYSHNPREIWAEVFASKLGESLGIKIQKAIPKKLSEEFAQKFLDDYSNQLPDPEKWQKVGVLVQDVFPKGFDQVKGRDLLGATTEDNTFFDLAVVGQKLKSNYYASDDLLDGFAEMLIFDFLLGNMDRHQENWAINQRADAMRQLLLIRDKEAVAKLLKSRTFCPLFDHGSSLMYELTDRQVTAYLGDLDRYVKEYIVDRCKSFFTYDGNKISVVKLIAMHVTYLDDEWGKRFSAIIKNKVMRLDQLRVSQLILQMPVADELAYSYERKKLLDYSISKRCDILQNIVTKGTII